MSKQETLYQLYLERQDKKIAARSAATNKALKSGDVPLWMNYFDLHKAVLTNSDDRQEVSALLFDTNFNTVRFIATALLHENVYVGVFDKESLLAVLAKDEILEDVRFLVELFSLKTEPYGKEWLYFVEKVISILGKDEQVKVQHSPRPEKRTKAVEQVIEATKKGEVLDWAEQYDLKGALAKYMGSVHTVDIQGEHRILFGEIAQNWKVFFFIFKYIEFFEQLSTEDVPTEVLNLGALEVLMNIFLSDKENSVQNTIEWISRSSQLLQGFFDNDWKEIIAFFIHERHPQLNTVLETKSA